MLRHTPPPALTQYDARRSTDLDSETSSDGELPQCKIRRNYNCSHCTFFTQNPREYLVHVRDAHSGKFKIFDCPKCVYASKHHQKLLRHVKMVHGNDVSQTTQEPENIEDMFEEVEDTSDADDDIREESFRRSMEIEDRSHAEDAAASAGGNKKGLFPCSKCNYVTHLKSRYTKHVKYHSMPMIKCALCEFRTPYKWNLDRHMKNHGGGGCFSCSSCNFTADIKQSLTVHEMNHHATREGQSSASRRRNRVGASDVHADCPPAPPGDPGSDSRSSHSAPDIDESEMTNMMGVNDSNDLDYDNSNNEQEIRSSNVGDEAKQSKKRPRPIPQLIPLNVSTPNKPTTLEPPFKKLKESSKLTETENCELSNDNASNDISFTAVTGSKNDNHPKKKNESFFDKLKERLLTETGKEGSLTCKNCGFESKCLSEQSVHEKTCNPLLNRNLASTTISGLGSTRCQHCRHRCKSSADLYNHMKTCAANKTENEVSIQNGKDPKSVIIDEDVIPHPMENRVFVWNNISSDSNKFSSPLDISINEDSTLPPDANKGYDPNNVDALHDNEGLNLSPTQTIGKKVYKCPHCPFWASTASRFHVHIVGHLNKKPFECSLCQYKSNWRWDITKHIKLKSARDPDHNDAKVLMTDETGRRNYSKYNQFVAVLSLNEDGENVFQAVGAETSPPDTTMELDETLSDNGVYNENLSLLQPLPLNLQTQQTNLFMSYNNFEDNKKAKKTLWKCKKCSYKDTSREALLEHVREHSKTNGVLDDGKPMFRKAESTKDLADVAYRCGHCNQLSNWKHVIQRHCRLKHDGVIKVVATEKPKGDAANTFVPEVPTEFCVICPYKTYDKRTLAAHMVQHEPSSHSIFKCYFCNFFVNTEQELLQHLALHGVKDPEQYVAKTMGCKRPPDAKRHRCNECPYQTNSRTQFIYHEQFHKLPADTPYKCQECNYSVSKRHLLHQHMKVHGINLSKDDQESENEYSIMQNEPTESLVEEIPYVWVAAKNEFHKMYKCRYCSYVNTQECKIPNHEQIHVVVFDNSDAIMYKCLECKFTCDGPSVLAKHSKSHSEIYGRIYFNVERDVPDEEQIAKLREVIEEEKRLELENDKDDDDAIKNENGERKFLYFCNKCPSRFFSESELKIHERFHDLIFSNKCGSCEFSVPQESQLASHVFVHTDDYQAKTKMLKKMLETHPNHKEPVLELVHCLKTSDVKWIVSNYKKKPQNSFQTNKKGEPKTPKQYSCKICPAKFFKNSGLAYHMALHGGEGEYKCKKCNYTVKNIGNLTKHELLHDNEMKPNYESGDEIDYKIPLSGTDLFQRKTEAQKRVFTDKDKLVKPNDHFPPVLQADPQFGYLMHGNPEFIYPTYMKNGRQKEKRYKCHKCPSAFEKREQYKIHLSLHGSKQRYKCELCDYSVKYYANYVQHMRKHQMNDEAQAERKKGTDEVETENRENTKDVCSDNIKLAIKTMPRSIPKSDFQQFSVSDQQTLRLLQRRRSITGVTDGFTPETPLTKERKQHLCVLCPYSNQRQDALANHYKRHDNKDVLSVGSHKCTHCDFSVGQSHFLRDHLKTHFNAYKPESYAANKDVAFTITKIEEETASAVDITLTTVIDDLYKLTEEKSFVLLSTGEVVEQ